MAEDRGQAGPLKNQPATPEQGVINQPKDSLGFEVGSVKVNPSLTEGGNVNKVDSVKVAGSKAAF